MNESNIESVKSWTQIKLTDKTNSKERKVKMNPFYWVELTVQRRSPLNNEKFITQYIVLDWDEAVDIARIILGENNK